MRTTSTVGILAGALLMVGVGAAFQKPAQPVLPYKSIDDPDFILPSAAGFLSVGDRLIGVVSGNVAKAYPAAILAQHGVVLDQMPDGPIAVTW